MCLQPSRCGRLYNSSVKTPYVRWSDTIHVLISSDLELERGALIKDVHNQGSSDIGNDHPNEVNTSRVDSHIANARKVSKLSFHSCYTEPNHCPADELRIWQSHTPDAMRCC